MNRPVFRLDSTRCALHSLFSNAGDAAQSPEKRHPCSCKVWRILVGFVVFVSLPLAAAGEVLSIGHRGNPLFAPENTVASFRACSNKADLVECDVRVSSDGYLVVMHDATVDRTTDGTGAVSSMTLAQLKALDAGSWFSPEFAGERIPTLEEAVTNILPFATPLIEQKAGSAAAYVAELRRLNALTNVILQSFDWNFLSSVRALEPSIPLCALGSTDLTATALTNILNTGARAVAWERSKISAAEVERVHNAGLKLFVWTVDSPAEIQYFINLGVDGIITDNPGAVKEIQTPATNPPSAGLGVQLVAYWKMDDGLANPFTTVVSDSAGTNTATLVRNDGASHWLNASFAKLGGCLKLEGTNAYVVVPHTAALDIGTNELTFAAWLYLLHLPSQLSTSFGAIYDSTTDCYVLYLDRSNRELRFKITDANGHAARPGILETFLPTHQWIHVAATYQGSAYPAGGRAAIYLNGQLVDEHIGNDSTPGSGLKANVKSGQLAAMGREGPTGGNYFTGYVDDVAIWRRALAAAEIAHLFEAGQQGRSLGELTRQPSALLRIVDQRFVPAQNRFQILFHNTGPWTVFQLQRAPSPAGPFLPVSGLAPAALGDGLYRFDYPITSNLLEFFRIAGD